MIYIAGAVIWFCGWAFAIPEKPFWQVLLAAFASWNGLVLWELAMIEYRKNK